MEEIYYNTNVANYAPARIESICPDYLEDHDIIRLNGFPSVLFLFSLSGAGLLQIGDENFILNEGDSIIIDADYPYSYGPLPGQDWQTRFFSFSGDLIPTIKKILAFEHYLVVRSDIDDLSRTNIDNWYRLLTNQYDLINHVEIGIEVLQFFSDLKNILNRDIYNDSYTYRTYIQPTRRYIHEHYSEKITIKELANIVNISQQYLVRVYRSFLDISPQQYLLNYRISLAKKMVIQRPDLSVTEIAMHCGFSSTSQFITHFKKIIGTTPKQYRGRYTTIRRAIP